MLQLGNEVERLSTHHTLLPRYAAQFPSAGELGLWKRGCGFRTRPAPSHGRGRETAAEGSPTGASTRDATALTWTAAQRLAADYLLHRSQLEPRPRLLGNVGTVGGPGLGRQEEEPGELASPEGPRWVWKPSLAVSSRHSCFAVCPSGDLAKGREAAAFGETFSEGRRRAPSQRPRELRFHLCRRPGAAREIAASFDPESERQKQPSTSATSKTDWEKCPSAPNDVCVSKSRAGMQRGSRRLLCRCELCAQHTCRENG